MRLFFFICAKMGWNKTSKILSLESIKAYFSSLEDQIILSVRFIQPSMTEISQPFL